MHRRSYGLDTPEGDVATVKRTFGTSRESGHSRRSSYGGSVITAAGTDGRAWNSSISPHCSRCPMETSQSQQGPFPVTDVFKC